MTPLLLGALSGTVLSALLYLAIGSAHRRSAKHFNVYFFDDWSLDRRMIGATIFSSAMSLATVVVALLQLGVAFGLALSWATITFCGGWIVLWIGAPRIRSAVTPTDTIHSFLGRTYSSPALAKIASTATILGLVGLFATELFAADVVLGALGVPSSWNIPAILLFGGVTIAYAAVGGFRSAVRSDWSQTTLLLLAILVLCYLTYYNWSQNGRPGPLVWGSSGHVFLPLAVAVSIFFINVPFPFVDMQVWQRLIAARSVAEFRAGSLFATVAFAITWTALIILSIYIAPGLPKGTEPLSVLMRAAQTHATSITFLLGFLLVPGLFAAMFSSADGFLNSAAATFSLDLAGSKHVDANVDVSGTAPFHVVGLGIGALSTALVLRAYGFSIIDLVFAVSAGQLALLPPVLSALLRDSTIPRPELRWWAIASVGGGFFAAWLNGFYSVSSSQSTFVLWEWLETFVPRDTYRSPIYAVAVSASIFFFGYMASRATKLRR